MRSRVTPNRAATAVSVPLLGGYVNRVDTIACSRTLRSSSQIAARSYAASATERTDGIVSGASGVSWIDGSLACSGMTPDKLRMDSSAIIVH